MVSSSQDTGSSGVAVESTLSRTHRTATAAWCLLLLALGVLDVTLLTRALRVRSQQAQVMNQMPAHIGSCEGIDVRGRAVTNACGDGGGAVVVVLSGERIQEQLSTWVASAGQAPIQKAAILGVCADLECVRVIREANDPPFPILSAASYSLARAAGLADQQGTVLVVGTEGSIRARLPTPRTANEVANLWPRIAETLNATSRAP
jgi:hypothetical protein